MGNTVARSHIRDADRGVAKATRVNTRRNSTNTPAPPPPISSPTASTSSSPPEHQNLPDSIPGLPETRHSFVFGTDPLDPRPVKRRARHVSAETAFVKPPVNHLPDPSEPPPGASPAEVHAARTETPPRVDKPPRARKVVSFNENVHVVTYPYEASNHASAELPAVTRYPEPKYARRRSRSVFRLLSRAPNDHQCLAYDACCGLRIASSAQVVYDDQPDSDDRLPSFDSSKDLYENGLVVSYERPYSDAVADDFDYVHREVHGEEQEEEREDDDTFSLSDAHPSCDAIDEPEAIGDQLLSREDSRDQPAFDIAPLWQRLKRVDELDAVSKNTFLRESARRRHVHDAKPPRPPRRDVPGISHSRAARVKARRGAEGSPSTVADKSDASAHVKTPAPAPTPSGDGTKEKLPNALHAKVGSQAVDGDSVKSATSTNSRETTPTKSITSSTTTPESSPKPSIPENAIASQPEPRAVKEPDPAQERRIPAPARSRATSAGSIQKHMASFTTESAVSADKEVRDDPPVQGDRRERDDPFASNPIVANSSAVTVEPKSEKTLPTVKGQDIPNPGRSRVRSEPLDGVCETQPLATSIRTSQSARVPAISRASPDEPPPVRIQARATVRPAEEPMLPETAPNGENISHSWARLNDLTRKRDNSSSAVSGSKRSFSATLRESLSNVPPIEFPEDDNERELSSIDRESERTSTLELDLDPLSLPTNDDYGIPPCSPVQGYAPVAGVYYGNSSPSTTDPGSPRLGLAETENLPDYPEYEMLNGKVNDDCLFDSGPNTPILGANSNWAEPFEEAFLGGLEDDMRAAKGLRGNGRRDRNARQVIPEVLLHDWSGSTPVEPNVEMVDSAPNSRSSTSHLFTEDHSSKTPKREGGSAAAILSKRMNIDISTLYQTAALKLDVEATRPKKAVSVGPNAAPEKIGNEKGTSSLRRSRSDRAGPGGEIDASAKLRGYGRGKRFEAGKKFSLSNTEAWISSDYEVKEVEHRAKSDAHEPARAFFPAIPVSLPTDPKLQDFQISVERKSVSEMGYRKGVRTGRGPSFVDRELTGDRGLPATMDTWRDVKEEQVQVQQAQAQKRVGAPQRRRRPSDGDNNVGAGNEGTLRGMMGRLVSGMHMAKRLVTPN